MTMSADDADGDGDDADADGDDDDDDDDDVLTSAYLQTYLQIRHADVMVADIGPTAPQCGCSYGAFQDPCLSMTGAIRFCISRTIFKSN